MLAMPETTSDFFAVTLSPETSIFGRIIGARVLVVGALLWGARARVTSASASLDAVSSMERSRNLRRALLVGIAVDLIDVCSCVVGVLDGNKNRRAVGWLCGGAVYLLTLGGLGLRGIRSL
jgi:hypothetical protein